MYLDEDDDEECPTRPDEDGADDDQWSAYDWDDD